TEAVVLDLLRELIKDQSTSALFITHNLGVVANLTDRVAVLYAGELVEDAPTSRLYQQPLHPYTQGLINSVPRLEIDNQNMLLSGIPGQIPSMDALPSGCVFAPRCPLVVDRCLTARPPLEQANQDRRVRCYRWREIQSGEISIVPSIDRQAPFKLHRSDPLLAISDLEVVYPVRPSGPDSLLRKKKVLKAVDGVSLHLGQARTLGIVGESGSGKSSLALAIMGLVDAPEGEISLLNIKIPGELRKRDQETLRKLQMVFQHHDEAFSPYLKVEQILSRPLINLLGISRQAAQEQVSELLEMVRLPGGFAQRYPHQLSGGEKQRVAIAQAFAANPNLLIADEPVSALDVSVQANILNLLKGLQQEQQTAILLISHDIGAVSYLADEVAVMYLGQVMQFSAAGQLLRPPFHPYTEALLSAIPVADPAYKPDVIHLEGEIPNPIERPPGCPFHTRCPRSLGELCQQQTPPWQSVPGGGKIFCHIPFEDLRANQKASYSAAAEGANG
ncbi:MAG: oligopeptide/dipeptide ABC transporter ATP-binding protein, partial [Chloroflexota bacterium]